ncbi:hypothetical protein ACFQZJ_06370 [Maribacter chungangensis]|uniref:Outer membrane insertion C-signal n=1 Tax=Maribacter chungangensis TaxID=1069117 RepID=A0ABW3B1A0_9FLAO
MKKLALVVIAIIGFGVSKTNAQSEYNSAAGLGIDFGSDIVTLVGPSGKFFFQPEHAVTTELLFGSDIMLITALYQYHGNIEGAEGLKWFAGAGPSLYLGIGDASGSSFALRPSVGLDYKINNVPLAFSFDWRPAIIFEEGSGFQGAQFGLGFRYAFN